MLIELLKSPITQWWESGKVIRNPYLGPDHHQKLITSRGSPLAHACHGWSTSVTMIVSYPAHRTTERMTERPVTVLRQFWRSKKERTYMHTSTISGCTFSSSSFTVSVIWWLTTLVSADTVNEGLVSVWFSAISSTVEEVSVSARLSALSTSADLSVEFCCSCHAGITGAVMGNAGNCFLNR